MASSSKKDLFADPVAAAPQYTTSPQDGESSISEKIFDRQQGRWVKNPEFIEQQTKRDAKKAKMDPDFVSPMLWARKGKKEKLLSVNTNEASPLQAPCSRKQHMEMSKEEGGAAAPGYGEARVAEDNFGRTLHDTTKHYVNRMWNDPKYVAACGCEKPEELEKLRDAITNKWKLTLGLWQFWDAPYDCDIKVMVWIFDNSGSMWSLSDIRDLTSDKDKFLTRFEEQKLSYLATLEILSVFPHNYQLVFLHLTDMVTIAGQHSKYDSSNEIPTFSTENKRIKLDDSYKNSFTVETAGMHPTKFRSDIGGKLRERLNNPHIGGSPGAELIENVVGALRKIDGDAEISVGTDGEFTDENAVSRVKTALLNCLHRPYPNQMPVNIRIFTAKPPNWVTAIDDKKMSDGSTSISTSRLSKLAGKFRKIITSHGSALTPEFLRDHGYISSVDDLASEDGKVKKLYEQTWGEGCVRPFEWTIGLHMTAIMWGGRFPILDALNEKRLSLEEVVRYILGSHPTEVEKKLLSRRKSFMGSS